MNNRLKELRKELGLTQREFAEKIGIKQNTVAQYEMGRNNPIDAVIALICRRWNVNENWLRSGKGSMFIEQTRDEQIAAFIGGIQSVEDDSFKKRLISLLSEMSEAEWELLEQMVIKLIDKMA